MSAKTTNTIAVIGAGVMGRGIAQLALQNGFIVKLFDVNQEMTKTARNQIMAMLEKLNGKGKLSDEMLDKAKDDLICCQSMAEFVDAGLVIEAIAENLKIKQSVFTELESIVSDDCILASNTSSLSITSIASACQHKGRVVGIHFFNPAPLMKIVEIIPGIETAKTTVERANQIIGELGHQVVNVKDAPGFLVNHAGRGYVIESTKILSEHIAGITDIDQTMKQVLGFRMGPLELMDLTGLDITFAVMESIYEQFHNEPRLRPTSSLRLRVEGGIYGRKTTRGFYRYEKNAEGKLEQHAVPAHNDVFASVAFKAAEIGARKVWIDDASVEVKKYLTELLRQQNINIDDGIAPQGDSIVIALPIFDDLTSYLGERGFNTKNTVAVDLLANKHLFGGLGFDVSAPTAINLMSTPATKPEVTFALYKVLRNTAPTYLLNDSPGFIAPRILAVMINNACEIAQAQIASPEDINKAVKVALGYPHGLLDWGDAVGAGNVVALLDSLYATYQDPRYRPSLWLKRRAALGLSLMQTDLI